MNEPIYDPEIARCAEIIDKLSAADQDRFIRFLEFLRDGNPEVVRLVAMVNAGAITGWQLLDRLPAPVVVDPRRLRLVRNAGPDTESAAW